MTQTWNAEAYARNAAFVPALGRAALALLAPQPGERILDLGCGDGTLTRELAATGARAIGVDASPQLVAAARTRGIDARLGDGCALEVEDEFDAVFSNAALHWMNDQDAVLAGVRRALRPGGRFVAEFGGHGNVAAICTALLAVLGARDRDRVLTLPWYFPTADGYGAKLAAHGFTIEQIALIARPTPLPNGMRAWLETFANPFFAARDASSREQILDDATRLLAPTLCDDEGRWTADYVRLRFRAHR